MNLSSVFRLASGISLAWLGLASSGVAATSLTWQGGSGLSTDTPANWVGGTAPTALTGTMALTPSYDFTFTGSNTTVRVQTGDTSTQYMTQSILFNAGAGAFNISADDGSSKTLEDRFLLLNEATITQSSAANQTINATVLLNSTDAMPTVFATVKGDGAGSLTLNSIRFAGSAAGSSRTLYLARNTTVGSISFVNASTTGVLRVGEGAAVTFSGASPTNPVGDASLLTLQLGFNSSGGASSAVVQSTATFTAASAVQAYDVTFAGTQQMTFSGGFALQGSGSRTLNVTNTHASGVTLSGVVSGSGIGLTKTGAGLLVFSGSSNTYTGLTDVQAGTLRYGASDQIANAAAVQVSGGTLDLATFSDTVGAVTLKSGSITSTTGILTGTSYAVESGSASAILAGASVALTKSTAGSVTLSGVNTYTGRTTINEGILSVSNLKDGGSSSGIGASSNGATNLILNGGTLAYTGAAQSTDRLFSVGTGGGTLDASGSGAANFTNTGSLGFNSQTGVRTLTLTGSNPGDNTLAAVIGDNSGATSLVKAGAGKWSLSGANTYTGTTLVSGGTLVLSGGGSIVNSAIVDVASGATLNTSAVGTHTFGSGQAVKGRGTIIGNTILQGTLSAGNSPGILTFTDNLTLAASTNSIFEIQNALTPERGTDYDGVNVGGLLTYDGTLTLSLTTLVANATYHLFDFGSYNLASNFDSVVFSGGAYTGTFEFNAGSSSWTANSGGQTFSFSLANGDLIVLAIPEPSTALLLAGGLMAILFLRRRVRN